MLIAAYQRDPAALNTADKLIKIYGFRPADEAESPPTYVLGNMTLVHLDIDDIHADRIDRRFPCDHVIFASRHKSESAEPTLTTHVSGNLGEDAAFGGSPRSLAISDPQAMRTALLELTRAATELKLDGYSISLEATHHGPTELEVPSHFVEIGSTEREWRDPKAGEAAARAIYASANAKERCQSAVGFGGGHYASKHTRLTLAGDYAVGHILPKYFFDHYDPAMVKLAFKRTFGDCRLAIVDWKGMRGEQRRRLLEDLEKMPVEVVRA